jgi:TolB-like protein
MNTDDQKHLSTTTNAMFVDIVGFTAMMQQEEERAFDILEKFQTGLHGRVPAYGGQVINFYGDGALCIFPDSLLALKCAMELQTYFRGSPLVPVRIGLHYGRVRFEANNVFGHTINVTSRIESMGVPGAILFSQAIKERIRDQHDIQMISLGSFDYKNVEGAIEVYALANIGFPLPRRLDLKGKFKEVDNESQALNKSIAVLPFEAKGSDPEVSLLGEGFAEEIIFALSKMDGLKVSGKVSSFSFKGQSITSSEIGNRLQVETVLYGSVQKSGDRLRVTAELVKASEDSQIWTERFDRTMTDIFDLQEDVAREIVAQLQLKLLQSEVEKSLVNKQTNSLEAYQLYLRGRQYLEQRTALNLAIDCYKNAIKLDADYALAYSGLSYAYFYQVLFDFKPPSMFIQAQVAAEKAMLLDANLAEAYIIDGIVYFYYYWNPRKALAQYRRALEISANADIYRILAYYHSMLGDATTAEYNGRKALELDPLNLGVVLGLGEVLYRCGHFAQAMEVFEDMLIRFPNNKVADAILGACYYHGGYREKAEKFFAHKSFDPNLILFYALPHFYYLLEKNRKEEAHALLEIIENQPEGKWISPLSLAMVYFGLGDMTNATSLLQKGITERDPILWIIHSEPTWQAFREDPVIEKILEERFIPR